MDLDFVELYTALLPFICPFIIPLGVLVNFLVIRKLRTHARLPGCADCGILLMKDEATCCRHCVTVRRTKLTNQ